ncbi:MAG: hypothetical protein LBJ32_02165 [Oscillospiraceae bacterium]|jgi:hypothetical protein|nr:hypothetical protein [Oscillospiraceae bacterium]
MVRKLKNKKMKESLKNKYGKLLGYVGKVRIVPLSTSDFSRFLASIIRL